MPLRLRARLTTVASAAALALTTLPAAAAEGPRAPAPVRCAPFSAQIPLGPDAHGTQRIAGTLCEPLGRRARTAQLLLHGGTYDHTYWTIRSDARSPSYAEAAARAGHAALAVDRLGTGRSSAPHSSRFTDDTHEKVVLHLTRVLRERGHRKVVLTGNSFGATVARMVAARYPGAVQGLILTGEGAPPDEGAFEQMGALYRTASGHPLLARRGLDDGYVALAPGGKAAWFYDHSTADPRVVLHDELHPEPDVYPADPGYGDVALNRRITVPVLVVVGQNDRLICGGSGSDCSSSVALRASAAPLYGPKARLEAIAVPRTGHVLNLHRTTSQWYDRAQEWVERRVDGAG
ncbi:alpha/beta hydrolase [Streptomyces sp. 2BBP-J2]|nr:alpha/beta hydrolase [Streptomyces sp. 2BBP-J2]